MDLYRKFIEEKRKAFDNFQGIGFAFSNKQFEEMLIKLNAQPKDLYDLGAGTFILKNRYDDFMKLINYYDMKLDELMKDYNFAYSGFTYELANHEYNITYDYESTLEALNLTEDEILNNDVLLKAFKEARKTVIENSIY